MKQEPERTAGVLLHVSSLPGPCPVGDFGPAAHRFADWLAGAGLRWWQVLPLGHTDPFYASSPYRSISTFALNPLFVSPELLVRDRLLSPSDIEPPPGTGTARTDYRLAAEWKDRLLDRAWQRWKPDRRFERFCRDNAGWLDDYALYRTLKNRFGGLAWTDWPSKLRDRDDAALSEIADVFSRDVDRARFVQYVLFRQWQELRHHCLERGVGIIGDLPIYVDADSADCWANPQFFKLDRRGRPRVAAGVPPDYFSKTGQLWGNPLYNWRSLGRNGYRWWLGRLEHALRLFDRVRIDHFRGLVACWQVPAKANTARKGRWVRVPAISFLSAVRKRFPGMPFIAEDLGHITPDVVRVRKRFGLPGMVVLQFALGRKDGPLDRLEPETVLYTGTHDNNTTRGWFEHEATGVEKADLRRRLGRTASPATVGRMLVRLAFESRARAVIVPMQDVLGLGPSARMNTPGTTAGNWTWRLREGQVTERPARWLAELAEATGRRATGPS